MRLPRSAALLALVLALSCLTPAAAQGYSDDEGFFVFLDAALLTPGDTDQVVGTTQMVATQPQTSGTIAFDWGAGMGLSAGFGYSWGESKVSVSYWQFDHDETLFVDGPSGSVSNFAIGPASYYYFPTYGYYVPVYYFGVPGSFDFNSKLTASLIDVTFASTFEAGSYFDLEWSVGVRFASFEEDIDGQYDVCASTGCDAPYSSTTLPGELAFAVDKTNEGDMLGARAGLRGRYYFSDIVALTSGAGVSLLAGEVSSRSGLTPNGTFNGADPPTLATRTDDTRTGVISDLDLGVEVLLVDEQLRLFFGLTYSRWDGVVSDLVRNTPGIAVANKDRDSISFSGAGVGVLYRF